MLDDLKTLVGKITPQNGEYLVSCFFHDSIWHADFYNKETKKMTSYQEIDGVLKSKVDEIFRKEQEDIEALDLDNVKVGRLEALDLSGIKGKKIMVILHVIEGKTLWNITGVTDTFEVHNVRVNAQTKEIEKETKESIFNFKKK